MSNLYDDDEKKRVLESLIKKRKKHPDNDEAFFETLDKVEQVFLTHIHFGLYKVNEEDKALLQMSDSGSSS